MDHQPLITKTCADMFELVVAVKNGKHVLIATKNPKRYTARFKHYTWVDIRLIKVMDNLFDVKIYHR